MRESPGINPESGRRIQSFLIGMSVLRVIEGEPGLMLRDVAERTGMARAKAHLYLVTLVSAGLLSKGPNGGYVLGPYALQLGLAALNHSSVVDMADETLRQLSDDVPHLVQLAVWANQGPTVVRKIDGKSQTPLSIKVGYVLPLRSSASGRLFSAYQPWKVVQPLLAAEIGARNVDAAALAQEFEATRADGFARTSGRLYEGYSALSAPIFDHHGDIAAAITLVDLSGKIDAELGGATAHRLSEATRAVSRRLGWTGPKPSRVEA